MISTDRLVVAVVALAEAGVPPDVQELLLHGDAERGIPPHALRKALEAIEPANEPETGKPMENRS